MESERAYAFGAVLKRFRQRRRLTQTQLAKALGVHRHTIGSWEQGDYLPDSKGVVLELARLLQLTDHEARQLLEAGLTALSPPWYVPFPRNPFFTGREVLLETLHSKLSTAHTVALTHSYALHGLGRIGKTNWHWSMPIGMRWTTRPCSGSVLKAWSRSAAALSRSRRCCSCLNAQRQSSSEW